MTAVDGETPLERAKRYKRDVDSAVKGHWETALSVLATDLADAIEQGSRRQPRHVPCPVHGGTDGFRMFPDWRESGGGVCNTCGKFGDGFALLMWLHGGSFADTVRRVGDVFGVRHPDDEPRHDTGGTGQKPTIAKPLENAVRISGAVVKTERLTSTDEGVFPTLSQFGRQLWDACDKLQGVALAYLEARNCVVPPVDGDLRFHPALRHPISDYEGPALVGLITDFVTGEPLSLHKTWIQASGKKAEVAKPRMYLGRHRKRGGVIKLWPDDALTQGLALAEGIETALSLAHGFTPVWAAIDAGNLAALPPLPGVTALTIAVDRDVAGERAAAACAALWHAQGCEVRLVEAGEAGLDLNDLAVAA